MIRNFLAVTKDTFIHLIQHSGQVSSVETASLEEVIENFPYCQWAHLLMAKVHHQLESTEANAKITKAAVYAVNRNVLKKILFAKPGPQEVISVTPSQPAIETRQPAGAESAEVQPQPELTIDPPEVSLFDQTSATPPAESNPVIDNTNVSDQKENPETGNRRFNKIHQNEIIESFIKKEPRISSSHASKKDVPATDDLSEKSIAPSIGLISENLANIMIKQGKIDKAIDIYEKLILKYPQKKAYFASKIEDLKKL